MTGNWAALAFSKNQNLKKLVTASVLCQPPLDLKSAMSNLKHAWNGYINRHLFKKARKAVFAHNNIAKLKPFYKNEFDINIVEFLQKC